MKINYLNKKSKFRNTKLFKGLVIGSCALTIASSLSGCSKYNDKQISEIISNEMSFEEILNSVSDKTNLDKILASTNYIDLLNDYTIARQNKDLKKVCEILDELGSLLLKSSICNTLLSNEDIYSSDDLISVDLEYVEDKNAFNGEYTKVFANISYYEPNSKVVSGNIKIPKDIINKTYLLSGEIFDLAYNINDCRKKNINSLEYTDKIFLSYERYLLTTGKLDNDEDEYVMYKYDGIMSNHYDEEKVKTIKK